MCACPSVSDCQSQAGFGSVIYVPNSSTADLSSKRQTNLRTSGRDYRELKIQIPSRIMDSEDQGSPQRSRCSTPNKQSPLFKLDMHPGDEIPRFIKRKFSFDKSSKIRVLKRSYTDMETPSENLCAGSTLPARTPINKGPLRLSKSLTEEKLVDVKPSEFHISNVVRTSLALKTEKSDIRYSGIKKLIRGQTSGAK